MLPVTPQYFLINHPVSNSMENVIGPKKFNDMFIYIG